MLLEINNLPERLSICSDFLFNSLLREIVATSYDPVATSVEIGLEAGSHNAIFCVRSKIPMTFYPHAVPFMAVVPLNFLHFTLHTHRKVA